MQDAEVGKEEDQDSDLEVRVKGDVESDADSKISDEDSVGYKSTYLCDSKEHTQLRDGR